MKRDISVDVAKGIGIILVCYGHCKGTMFSFEVFAFHMPLFFMISGFFLKQDNLKDFLYKRCRTLLIPLIFFYTLTLLLKVPFQLLTATEKSPIEKLLTGELFQIEKVNSPLWFLIALIVALAIIWVVRRVFQKEILQNLAYLGLTLLGLFFCYIKIAPPCYFAQALLAVPFIIMGNYYHKYIEKMNPLKLFFFSLIIFLISFHFQNGKTNMSTLTIDKNPLCFFIPAIAGSVMVISFSVLLEKYVYKKIVDIIAYLGVMSLFIMSLHENIRFSFITKILHLFPAFSWGILETMYLTIGACLLGLVLKSFVPYLFDYKCKLKI